MGHSTVIVSAVLKKLNLIFDIPVLILSSFRAINKMKSSTWGKGIPIPKHFSFDKPPLSALDNQRCWKVKALKDRHCDKNGVLISK